jgi:cytidylate kinase
MTVIAMTREIGSDGAEVAAGVAAELGLEIINSEIIVTDVAGSLGVTQSAVQRYLDGTASMFERWMIDTRKLSRHTSEQIIRLAQRGNVLIRGWGASALFREIPQVLSVRICAPMEVRERVMMERLGLKNAEDVRAEIERFDAARASTLQASFNVNRADALLYHIVLNTGRVPIDSCVRVICSLARDQQFKDEAAMQSVIADKLLETKVRTAFVENFGVEIATITVTAAGGKIILGGVTSDGSLPAKVEKLARGVKGVQAVANSIESVPPVSVRSSWSNVATPK